MGVNLLILLKAMYAVIHRYIYVYVWEGFLFFFSFLFLFLVIFTGTPCLAQFTPLLLVRRISKRRVCTKLLRAFNNLRLLKSAEEKDILTKQNLGARVFICVNYGILIKKI